MEVEGSMEKKVRFIAGGLILAALILTLSLLGRERNRIAPQEETSQAVEQSQTSRAQKSAGDTASHAEGREISKTVTSAAAFSGGETDTEKGADDSPLSAEEFNAASGFTSETPMTSAEFKALVEERKEADARERGPEALEEYRARTEAREEERLSREELRQKMSEYSDERREWKRLMDEARDRARDTGDFAEVERLREMRPKPPKREPPPPGDGEGG
jgi:hypothetical protein